MEVRVKHYLLDWMDNNREQYIRIFGEKTLKELSKEELFQLFSLASTKDGHKLARI